MDFNSRLSPESDSSNAIQILSTRTVSSLAWFTESYQRHHFLPFFAKAGFLTPQWYQEVAPTLDDLPIASIIWGFTLASGLFAAAKAVQQTRATWKRSRRIHAYATMVWAEWTVSTVIGVLSWLFIRGIIRARYARRDGLVRLASLLTVAAAQLLDLFRVT